MLEDADILVEQFRPGVMEKLGLGYETLRKDHPRLIYCSITGYGQSGPRAQQAGHDLNYIGNTGLLGLAPGPADRPVVPPALIADIGGGAFPAVINILLALRRARSTGQGCHLDIAMTDAMFTFAWHALASDLGEREGAWRRAKASLRAAHRAIGSIRRKTASDRLRARWKIISGSASRRSSGSIRIREWRCCRRRDRNTQPPPSGSRSSQKPIAA